MGMAKRWERRTLLGYVESNLMEKRSSKWVFAGQATAQCPLLTWELLTEANMM